MFGTRVASRQDGAIQVIVFVVLVGILVISWRVLNAQSLMNQLLRARIPEKPFIVLEGNATMAQVAAGWQTVILWSFSTLGFATAQNARTVGMWPQTAAGSFNIAAWSALAFACVATAASALGIAVLPAPSDPEVTSFGPVPACVTATLALQAVSAWLVAHAINRGWEKVNGKSDPRDIYGCAAILGVVMVLIGLASYGFLPFPINAFIPRPDHVAQSDLSTVPFYWVTGLIGLPDWACLTIPPAVGALTVLAGAWLVVREPLRPGMGGGFLARRRKA